MKSQFIVPIVTPLTKERRIDQRAMADLLERMVQSGISGIVLLGSIGEFFAFDRAQKRQLIELAARQVRGRARLIVGIGSMDMEESVELAALSKSEGIGGVICISPYYFNLPERDIEDYYDQVISRVPMDFYLYNFPARTGYELTPELTYNLCKRHSNIVGFKDSVAGMEHTRQLLSRIRPEFPDFAVYCGFDDSFAHTVLSGGAGAIGGLSNIMPEVCMEWVRAMECEDVQEVARVQRTVDDMMQLYQIAPLFIPAIKKAMQLRGVPMSDVCSAPIGQVTENQAQQIEALLRRNALL